MIHPLISFLCLSSASLHSAHSSGGISTPMDSRVLSSHETELAAIDMDDSLVRRCDHVELEATEPDAGPIGTNRRPAPARIVPPPASSSSSSAIPSNGSGSSSSDGRMLTHFIWMGSNCIPPTTRGATAADVDAIGEEMPAPMEEPV